jgi:hypothetical protein
MLELERRMPVRPPKVNKKMKPFTQRDGTEEKGVLDP